MKRKEYQQIIRPLLSDHRYRHSVNVAKEAVRLAKRYGADPEKAETAGILHDIMKDTGPGDQLKIMERAGIVLTEVEQNAPKLWHAISGALYVERELGVHDREILDAIRYHTTGRVGMSLLERVIFVADFTSEERDYNGADGMRAAANVSLERAMLEGVTFTLRDLSARQKPIHPDTLATYNWMVLQSAGEKLKKEG